MHVRTQVGTRIEETANQFAQVQKAIRKIVQPGEIETLADNIGMPLNGSSTNYRLTVLPPFRSTRGFTMEEAT
jgi:hypothetical protein